MKVLVPSLLMLVVMTLITGVAYPLAITAVAHNDGDPMLLGHEFTEPKDFWSRPSAAAYNGKSSTGTNYGPMSDALADMVKKRVDALHEAGDVGPPPVDLVTASGSGLDPHISRPKRRAIQSGASRSRARARSRQSRCAHRERPGGPHYGPARRAARQCRCTEPCIGWREVNNEECSGSF